MAMYMMENENNRIKIWLLQGQRGVFSIVLLVIVVVGFVLTLLEVELLFSTRDT